MSEALIASRMPYAVEVEKGRSYCWCACGRSQTQPWCDGSHQGSGLAPMQFTAKYSEKIWLCGWSGGPDHYIERFGHPRLRARHLPFAIAGNERDQWLSCMQGALRQCALPDDLQRRLLTAFFQTADWMRNQAEP